VTTLERNLIANRIKKIMNEAGEEAKKAVGVQGTSSYNHFLLGYLKSGLKHFCSELEAGLFPDAINNRPSPGTEYIYENNKK